jgi:hypothetical protein
MKTIKQQVHNKNELVVKSINYYGYLCWELVDRTTHLLTVQ